MIEIYSDGATVGKNGKLGTVTEVGLGVWIPSIKLGVSKRVAGISNNEAEFKALILAMETAINKGFENCVFYLDSQIVVNRANGSRPKKKKWSNPRMDAFQDEVFRLRNKFNLVDFKWVPREENSKADFYSKQMV